jgi:hypothetical protein
MKSGFTRYRPPRQWNGWWGGDPPFHAPVFVLTRHARDPQSRAATSVTHVTYRVLS